MNTKLFIGSSSSFQNYLKGSLPVLQDQVSTKRYPSNFGGLNYGSATAPRFFPGLLEINHIKQF